MTNLAVSSSANANSVAASTTAATSTSGSGSAYNLTSSDFMELLTAQMKYQSPTNPTNSSAMTEELASISTVQGIDQLNTQVSNINTSTGAGQMAQASALVGKQVAVSGNNLITDNSGTATGAFTLANSSANTIVTVYNPNGTIADTANLGANSAGQQTFTWNGGTPGTQYTYQISATNAAGNAVGVTPYTVYTVQGVNVTGGAPTLSVEGSPAALPVSSVTTILGASS
jgi:flagellar basal-body rod modification protein FlgD